eukprot:1008260-Prymnesium_polylepis.1
MAIWHRRCPSTAAVDAALSRSANLVEAVRRHLRFDPPLTSRMRVAPGAPCAVAGHAEQRPHGPLPCQAMQQAYRTLRAAHGSGDAVRCRSACHRARGSTPGETQSAALAPCAPRPPAL